VLPGAFLSSPSRDDRRAAGALSARYSHSIVAGGFDEMS
jgi:hypothetical protein